NGVGLQDTVEISSDTVGLEGQFQDMEIRAHSRQGYRISNQGVSRPGLKLDELQHGFPIPRSLGRTFRINPSSIMRSVDRIQPSTNAPAQSIRRRKLDLRLHGKVIPTGIVTVIGVAVTIERTGSGQRIIGYIPGAKFLDPRKDILGIGRTRESIVNVFVGR